MNPINEQPIDKNQNSIENIETKPGNDGLIDPVGWPLLSLSRATPPLPQNHIKHSISQFFLIFFSFLTPHPSIPSLHGRIKKFPN